MRGPRFSTITITGTLNRHRSAHSLARPNAGGWFQRFWMRPAGGYQYAASIPAGALREGPNEFLITVFREGAGLTFPGALPRKPWDWDWYGRESWKLDLVGPQTPLLLFAPRAEGSSAWEFPRSLVSRSSTWSCRWTRAAGARPTTPRRW
jgi:hypothetical protein